MKPSTKIVIFVITAFIVILGITLLTRPAAAPKSVITPVVTTPATSTPSTVKAYTLAEVAVHATTANCWTSIKGDVYDLTPFVTKHPGGVPAISQLCGKEGTATFTAMHGGQPNPEKMLASLKIGILAQ